MELNLKFFSMLLPLFCLSCEFPSAPERFFNKNVETPRFTDFKISEFEDGQHIAGSVQLIPNLSSLNFPIEMVTLSVDAERAFFDDTPPYNLMLRTSDFPDGKHTVMVGAVKKEPKLGLLNVVQFPTAFDTLSLYFDQTPPTPVVLRSVPWNSDFPKLTWSENTDANFYAYIIWRKGNYEFYPTYLDTIRQQNISSFTDTTAPVSCGTSLEYQVIVTNRSESAASNRIGIASRRSLPVHAMGRFTLTSKSANELYVWESGITAVSTLDNSYLRRTVIWDARAMALSKDESKLFVADAEQIHVLEARSFKKLATWATPLKVNEIEFVAGSRNRLYSAGIENSLTIIDTDSGRQIKKLDYFFRAPTRWAVSPDGNSLYIAEINSGRIQRLDISTDALSLLAAANTLTTITDIQISPRGDKLFLSKYNSNELVVLDARTLKTIGRIRVFPEHSESRIITYHAGDCGLYISAIQDRTQSRHDQRPFILEYNFDTLKLNRSWNLLEAAFFIISSPDCKFLYFSENDASTSADSRNCYIFLK